MLLSEDVCVHARVVEVVRIGDPVAGDVVGEELAIWDGQQVAQVLALVAAVPEAPLARCFLPAWGLRVHGDTDLLAEIAFCFRCNGARVVVDGRARPRQGIDAGSPEAQELLALFKACE